MISGTDNAIRNPEGIWINSNVFREEAIAFKKNGYYCPDMPNSYGWIEYWDEQLKRCKEGYSVGGVRITGHHYFYLNFVEIMLVGENTNSKKATKVSSTPAFWDGDYNYFWALDLAREGATREFVDGLHLDFKVDDKYLSGGHHMIVGKSRRKGYSYKNAAICANMVNSEPDTLVILGAFDKKYLYPRGTMGMASSYLDHINSHTAWTKAREYVDKQEHRKLSYVRIKNGVKIEEGYKSELMAITFKDNPDAARGKDAKLLLFEEAGKFPNLADSFVATKEGLGAGKYTTGQMIIFGCVCAGTKVYTNNGKVVNIEDLKQEDGIVGYNGDSIQKQDINWFKPPAKKNCYRIITTGNNIIECSDDHPLLSSRRSERSSFKNNSNVFKYSFKKAESIQIGDYIARILQIPIFGDTYYNHARLTGLMLTDGYFKGMSVCVDDDNTRNFIKENYSCTIRQEFTTSNGELFTDFYIRGMRDYFRSNNLYNKTKEKKCLPDNIDSYDKRSLSELIAGLFDGDGNVNFSESKNKTRIVLTNISLTLLEQVKYQLLKFGIHCNIYKENRNGEPSEGYEGQKDYIYRLYIGKDKDIELFKINIPIIHSKKIRTLSNFEKGNRNFNSHLSTYIKDGTHDYIKEDSILNDITFERVTKIECIGEQEVYNLNASGYHNYIANGFITANTGGDMESGTVDFARMFYNPEEFDLMPFVNRWDDNATNSYCGFFHPDYMNLEGFYDEQGNSDKEAAIKYEVDKRNQLRNAASSSASLQQRVQERPHKPSEAFLMVSTNDFPIQELQQQLNLVKRENLNLKKGQPVILTRREDGGIQSNPILDNSVSPIWEYAIKQEDITGCPVIYEYPVNNAPDGLYKIGYDPYRQDQAENSTSLGAAYVYKGFMRGQPTYDCIVASYIGRPNTSDDFHRNLEMLSELYNAEIGFENEVTSVKSYFQRRKKLHLLALQPDRVISTNIKNSKVSRVYGIHMVEKLKDAGEKYIKRWLLTEKNIDENGETILNLQTIYDPGLLEELIQYNRKGNFDRISAFIILQMYLEEEEEDKIYERNNYDVIKEMEAFTKNLFKK